MNIQQNDKLISLNCHYFFSCLVELPTDLGLFNHNCGYDSVASLCDCICGSVAVANFVKSFKSDYLCYRPIMYQNSKYFFYNSMCVNSAILLIACIYRLL